jgi:hypothetical protein
MKFLFIESKIIFRHLENGQNLANGNEDLENSAKRMIVKNENFKDILEIQELQNRIRQGLEEQSADYGIFSEEDKRKWQERLENVKNQMLSAEKLREIEQEFQTELENTRRMFENYKKSIKRNLKEAFTEKSAEEFITEFAKQNYETKKVWFRQLGKEIQERSKLREELIKLYPDLAEHFRGLRRHEMAAELKERKKNVEIYMKMLQKDRRHFSDKAFKQFITEFSNLSVEKQKQWIALYEIQEGGPRRALTKQFEQFSLARQRKYSKFWQLSSTKKREILKEMQEELDDEFKTLINRTPETDMSKQSKKFAIESFEKLGDDIQQKELRLKLMPDFIKAEAELTKEYRKKTQKMPEITSLEQFSKEKWENSTFEEKQQMVRDIDQAHKLIKEGQKLLQQELSAKTINSKTAKIFLGKLLKMNLAEMLYAINTFDRDMQRRRKQLDEFNNLSKKTQDKFRKEFEEGNTYKERLKILKKAKEHDEKLLNSSEKTSDKTKITESIKISPDLQKRIDEATLKAENFEKQGEIEKALTAYETILIMVPNHKEIKTRIKELKIELEQMEIWEDENILQTLIEEEAKKGTMDEELLNLQLAEEFIDIQSRVEMRTHSTKLENQQTHLEHLGKNAKELDKALLKQSGGKKRLDEDGEVIDVMEIDPNLLGKKDKDKRRSQIETLKGIDENDILPNINLKDESGKNLTAKEAENRLKKRREETEKELTKRVAGNLKNKPNKGERNLKFKKTLTQAAKKADLSVDIQY